MSMFNQLGLHSCFAQSLAMPCTSACTRSSPHPRTGHDMQGSAMPTSRRLHNNDLQRKCMQTSLEHKHQLKRANRIKKVFGRRPNRQFPQHRLQADAGPAKTREQKKCMRPQKRPPCETPSSPARDLSCCSTLCHARNEPLCLLLAGLFGGLP